MDLIYILEALLIIRVSTDVWRTWDGTLYIYIGAQSCVQVFLCNSTFLRFDSPPVTDSFFRGAVDLFNCVDGQVIVGNENDKFPIGEEEAA